MRRKPPSYRLHKPTGQAVVTLNGQDRYLGTYGSAPSREKYHRLLAEWEANGRRLTDHRPSRCPLTINAMLLRYWKQKAEPYYRKPDGSPSGNIPSVKSAMRRLRMMYGTTPAADFGPLCLQNIRVAMIDQGLAYTTINKQIGLMKQIFKWAASKEMVAVSVFHRLQTVDGLRAGRSTAKPAKKVRPVIEPAIDAVNPFVSRPVWGLIQLQLLTGARSGELVPLRSVDIDASGQVWTAEIGDHKTQHHGHRRVLCFGPVAQNILRSFMSGRPLTAFLFSPRDAIAERSARAPTHRQPDQKPSSRKTDRTVGQYYTPRSYYRAIERACDQAFPLPDQLQAEGKLLRQLKRDAGADPAKRIRWENRHAKYQHAVGIWRKSHRWHPHQLRHNHATVVRARFGIEMAQLALGHQMGSAITEVYAEASIEKVKGVAASIG